MVIFSRIKEIISKGKEEDLRVDRNNGTLDFILKVNEKLKNEENKKIKLAIDYIIDLKSWLYKIDLSPDYMRILLSNENIRHYYGDFMTSVVVYEDSKYFAKEGTSFSPYNAPNAKHLNENTILYKNEYIYT